MRWPLQAFVSQAGADAYFPLAWLRVEHQLLFKGHESEVALLNVMLFCPKQLMLVTYGSCMESLWVRHPCRCTFMSSWGVSREPQGKTATACESEAVVKPVTILLNPLLLIVPKDYAGDKPNIKPRTLQHNRQHSGRPLRLPGPWLLPLLKSLYKIQFPWAYQLTSLCSWRRRVF